MNTFAPDFARMMPTELLMSTQIDDILLLERLAGGSRSLPADLDIEAPIKPLAVMGSPMEAGRRPESVLFANITAELKRLRVHQLQQAAAHYERDADRASRYGRRWIAETYRGAAHAAYSLLAKARR